MAYHTNYWRKFFNLFDLPVQPSHSSSVKTMADKKASADRLRHFLLKLILNHHSAWRARRSLGVVWSGKRDSNPRPLPWQGNALPAELFPHRKFHSMNL